MADVKDGWIEASTIPFPSSENTRDKASATTCEMPGVCRASGGKESSARRIANSLTMIPWAGVFGRILTSAVKAVTLSVRSGGIELVPTATDGWSERSAAPPPAGAGRQEAHRQLLGDALGVVRSRGQ